ncbi:MAG: hypothetical protein K2Z81_24430 [Cyanobacteria bacterium]|nr:hypothetical protein [Cyanobacteriota bacterium]
MQTQQEHNASFYQTVISAGIGNSSDAKEASGPASSNVAAPHALSLEALDDFQCLDGWWKTIIVRDMVDQSQQSLPDLVLDFDETRPDLLRSSRDSTKGC